MTQEIADLINSHLNTTGVAVVVSAEHSCMAIRGIKKHGSTTVTSAPFAEFSRRANRLAQNSCR
jgi:GTP cyclohydrolase I